MPGGALDHAGHEGLAKIVCLGENPDPGVSHFAVREETLQPSAPKSAGENIGQLVIGRLVGGVIARVGGAEGRQHRIDDPGQLVARARRLGLGAVALARRLPVDAVETRVIEAVAHELPNLVEGGAIRLGRPLALPA